MIRVTIDLISARGEAHNKRLHEVEIWNDGEDTLRTNGNHGSYRYRIGRKGGGWGKTGRVRGFRRRQRNSIQLLREVLIDAYPQGRHVRKEPPL